MHPADVPLVAEPRAAAAVSAGSEDTTNDEGRVRVSLAMLSALVKLGSEAIGRAEVLLVVGMDIMARLGPEDPEVRRWCLEALDVLGPDDEDEAGPDEQGRGPV